MMATQQKKEECGKEPKKTFAPPTQKLHSMIPCGPDLPKEIGSPEAEAKPSLSKAGLEKKEKKATAENGANLGHEKKRRAQESKPPEKNRKEKLILTNAEFEEIVQIVLRKSLKECLGTVCETSCLKPIACIQSDKEPGIASSATDNDNGSGEGVMVPQAPEISASLEEEVTTEIRGSDPGQPIPAPSEKSLNRLYLNKRKRKAQDEKMEMTLGGHEHRQKDQLTNMIQNRSQTRVRQKRTGSGFGHCIVWVQCSSPNCKKWRRLCANIDPSVLPEKWFCDQNTDEITVSEKLPTFCSTVGSRVTVGYLDYNCCDIPEETWTGPESEVVYASYIPGSLIWAKQYGYPWWPGMVESDPDLGEYFLFASHLDSLPSKYHVTFFGETVSRAWIPARMLKNFQKLSLGQTGVKKYRNKDYIQKLEVAIMMAHKAEQTGIQERVDLFGFWSRYCESDVLSGANSPKSYTDKEEEEEEEKEEQKDPTLPDPKSTKMKTKNRKPRGMADRQGKIPKKKVTKKSLDSESAVTTVAMMERKEEQRKPDLEEPGPKKRFQVPQSKTSAIILSEEKEVRMVPKGLTPPAHDGAFPLVRKEGSRSQEPLIQEAGSVSLKDEASSDLDLEQIMEDIGRKSEDEGSPETETTQGHTLGLL